MRIAAGIILIILGMASALFLVWVMIDDIIHMGAQVSTYALSPYMLLFIPCAFIVTGGVFCIQIYSSAIADWLAWFYTTYFPVGILPVIFVYLRRADRQQSQAS